MKEPKAAPKQTKKRILKKKTVNSDDETASEGLMCYRWRKLLTEPPAHRIKLQEKVVYPSEDDRRMMLISKAINSFHF